MVKLMSPTPKQLCENKNEAPNIHNIHWSRYVNTQYSITMCLNKQSA